MSRKLFSFDQILDFVRFNLTYSANHTKLIDATLRNLSTNNTLFRSLKGITIKCTGLRIAGV